MNKSNNRICCPCSFAAGIFAIVVIYVLLWNSLSNRNYIDQDVSTVIAYYDLLTNNVDNPIAHCNELFVLDTEYVLLQNETDYAIIHRLHRDLSYDTIWNTLFNLHSKQLEVHWTIPIDEERTYSSEDHRLKLYSDNEYEATFDQYVIGGPLMEGIDYGLGEARFNKEIDFSKELCLPMSLTFETQLEIISETIAKVIQSSRHELEEPLNTNNGTEYIKGCVNPDFVVLYNGNDSHEFTDNRIVVKLAILNDESFVTIEVVSHYKEETGSYRLIFEE